MQLKILLRVFEAKVLLALYVLGGVVSPAHADVKVSKAPAGSFVLENAAIKVTVKASGGRISELINKKSDQNFVTLWGGGDKVGGVLDDGNVFTAMLYHGVVMRPGGNEGTVRFAASHPSGLTMTKYVTLRDDSSVLEIREVFANGTQQPAQLMPRHFMLPGAGPLTGDYHYFLPMKNKPLQPLIPANGSYKDLASPWSALWNSKTGDGLLVAAPGIEEFRFESGIEARPTTGWTYPEVPAGKSLSVNYAIQLIHNAAPDWPALAAETLKSLNRARLADVPDWTDENQRFAVADAERARGFWLSTGDDAGKRRLPQTIRIDAPLGEKRSVYVAVNALTDLQNATLEIAFKGIPNALVQTAWQVRGADSVEVVPFDGSTKIQLINGTEGRLWLTLLGGGKAEELKGQIEISLNGQKTLLPLEARVWPVAVPEIRPFHVRGYGTYPSALNGTHVITPASIKRVEALMGAFHEAGGDVFDFTVSWTALYPHLKIAGSEQSVSDWLKANRATFKEKPPAAWPEVDFSYCAPWVNAAKKYGLKRAATYLPITPNSDFSATEEEWILTQLKKYFESQGFNGYFCKIGDEISAEEVPDYISQAKIARRAGWRPLTTVTGLNARTVEGINSLNPHLDEWQLNLVTTGLFNKTIRESYRLETRTVEMPTQWGPYVNGGAKDTFAQKLFNAAIPAPPAEVENIVVFQDGKPLQRPGGTATGNTKRGVYFTGYNEHLYISPIEGTDAGKSKITVQYQVRIPTSTGQPLAKIDPTDEVWFYGGGSRPYTNTYGYAASYPLLALQGDYDGFGWYSFHSAGSSKVIWYDESSDRASISPPFIGLRDGWNDARLLEWLSQSKKVPVSQFISEANSAPLRIGDVQEGMYSRKDIINITDPFVLNDARQKMLAAALQP